MALTYKEKREMALFLINRDLLRLPDNTASRAVELVVDLIIDCAVLKIKEERKNDTSRLKK